MDRDGEDLSAGPHANPRQDHREAQGRHRARLPPGSRAEAIATSKPSATVCCSIWEDSTSTREIRTQRNPSVIPSPHVVHVN